MEYCENICNYATILHTCLDICGIMSLPRNALEESHYGKYMRKYSKKSLKISLINVLFVGPLVRATGWC